MEDLNEEARRSLPGYTLVGTPRTGALATGDTVDQRFSLRPGQRYGFLALGDVDALDVDLQVLDSNGNQVPVLDRRGRQVRRDNIPQFVEDTRSDEVAVVRFTPRTAGKYVVRAVMFNCQEPAPKCEYALGTYREVEKKKNRRR